MSIISIPYVFTVGAVIVAAQHNSNFSTIYNDYNGNITDANISASAGIEYSKLSLTGSVKQTDLISSFVLPTSQGGLGSDFSASVQGVVPYFSATGTISVLDTGTSGQVLKTGGASANPSWSNSLGGVSDYGTSTNTSSSKQGTALKIAFGTTSSLTNGGTFTITNLPFSSSSSYYVVCSPVTNTTVQSAYATNSSGSQCVLTSMSVPAGANVSCAYNWIAIGT